MDLKKNLIILIAALSAILITLAILNFLNLNGQTSRRAQLNGGAILPDYYPKKLSRSSVKFFILKASGDRVVFYEELESAVYETDYRGGPRKELAKIPGVYDLVFSPEGGRLIATIIEGGGFRKLYFDLAKNEKTKMNPNVKNLAFSPDGTKIAYHFYDPAAGEGNISISNPDGSVFKNIFKTRIKNLQIIWAEKNTIVLYSAEAPGLAFSIAPNGNDFKRLNESELSLELADGIKETQLLKDIGIETAEAKLSLLGNYLIYINASDGGLYSLKIR